MYKEIKLKTDKKHSLISNRHALILNYKNPFIKLHNKVYPFREPDPKERVQNTLPRVYLFKEKQNETHEQWLRKNYKRLFEEELHDRISEKKDWPKKRGYSAFRRYFTVSFSDLIIDASAGKPIEMI